MTTFTKELEDIDAADDCLVETCEWLSTHINPALYKQFKGSTDTIVSGDGWLAVQQYYLEKWFIVFSIDDETLALQFKLACL